MTPAELAAKSGIKRNTVYACESGLVGRPSFNTLRAIAVAIGAEESAMWPARMPHTFWSHVEPEPMTGCWLWTANRSENGYGHIKLNGKTWKVHRLVYATLVGELLDDDLVCHHCDTPPCCNPEHLFRGTQVDNMQDMLSKSRDNYAHGAGHYRATVNERDVVAMRERFDSGDRMSDIARDFGTSYGATVKICKRFSWRHVS